MRPELFGFDDGPGHQLGKEQQIETDVAHAFGETASFREQLITLPRNLAAGDIDNHADAVKRVKGNANRQGNGANELDPCDGYSWNHRDDERGILENPQQGQVENHRQPDPEADLFLPAAEFVLDDPRRGVTVADTRNHQQTQQAGIFPSVEHHARHQGDGHLPGLAVTTT